MKGKALLECKHFAAEWLRAFEIKRAGGNIQRLDELADFNDDEVLRRGLWMISIVGGPVVYLLLPFVLSILQTFIWAQLTIVLWTLLKIAMGLIFATFALAVYFTFLQDRGSIG
ncbi:MAG: hypothetical protein DKT66_15865 [Candidatus Melainabacteria bacterium]|nr:MAG: hypothetical protein DKT66_15865 [Candidatus Melainabacteria bacterium]